LIKKKEDNLTLYAFDWVGCRQVDEGDDDDLFYLKTKKLMIISILCL
jgi:hypothetical protein